MIKRFQLFVVLVLLAVPALCQEDAEMADVMRSNGKIYVVVGVIGIILIGLFAYLFSIERKLNNLESKNKSSNEN